MSDTDFLFPAPPVTHSQIAPSIQSSIIIMDPLFTNLPRQSRAEKDVNAFDIIYDPSITGWRPLSTNDLSAGDYDFTNLVINSGQYTVPAGVHSWSLTVESGAAYINNVGPYNAGYSIDGGGYGGFATDDAIVIGITGGHAYLSYETPAT